jgi:hypothetical protein
MGEGDAGDSRPTCASLPAPLAGSQRPPIPATPRGTRHPRCGGGGGGRWPPLPPPPPPSPQATQLFVAPTPPRARYVAAHPPPEIARPPIHPPEARPSHPRVADSPPCATGPGCAPGALQDMQCMYVKPGLSHRRRSKEEGGGDARGWRMLEDAGERERGAGEADDLGPTFSPPSPPSPPSLSPHV